MTNNEIYQLIDFICRSQDRGKILQVHEFNLLLKKANIEKFKKELGTTQEFAGSQPTTRGMYEMSQRISDSLRKFKVPVPTQAVVAGAATLPGNYFYPTSINYTYQNLVRPVEVLTDAQWGWRQFDANKAGSYKYPVCRFMASTIQFLPSTITTVDFTYLRLPVTPTAVYTTQNGVLTYATSVEMEWDDADQLDVINLMLLDMGIVSDPASITEYANMKKLQGT